MAQLHDKYDDDDDNNDEIRYTIETNFGSQNYKIVGRIAQSV